MLKMINSERSGYLGPGYELRWSNALAEVARAHSADMLIRNYFAHCSPEGKHVGHRLMRRRIPFYAAGENILLCPDFPNWSQIENAHRCLMNSKGHRKNILNPAFTHVAIGLANTQQRFTVTQVFINPRGFID